MHYILIKGRSLPQKGKELKQALTAMADELRMRKGCQSCDLYGHAQEDMFLWIEKWESPQNRQEALNSDLNSILLGALCVLCETAETEILTLEQTDSIGIRCG